MAAAREIELFTVDFTRQREWRLLILAAFFMGGVAAGLFLVSQFFGLTWGIILSLIIMVAGKGGAHLLYLGHPERFWRAVVRPSTSWISRGMIGLVVFVVFAVLYVAPSFGPFAWLPWNHGTGLGQGIRTVAALGAFWVMIYTGFVMAAPPSIPFWNNSILPVLFISYGFMGGIDLIFLSSTVQGAIPMDIKSLELVQLLLMTFTLILVAVYLGVMNSSSVAAKEAVRLLVRGELAGLFVGGVLIVGLLVPLAATAYAYLNPNLAITAFSGLLLLLGGLLFRYSVLRAGVYAPVL